jgi:hypothetical protein
MLALLSVPAIHAQLLEMEVKPTSGSGTVPVFRDHPDDAAIIVNSSLTGLRFDSNVGVVADLSSPNEGVYRIIVKPWRQTITVTMSGYRQARFTIPASEPRSVLYYNVEPVKSDAGALIPVTVRVNQADAAVFIDAQQVDITKTIPLEAGTHQIRIEKVGFLTIDQPIEVSTERPFQEFTMQRLTQRKVVIRTAPAGARIRINGIERAETTPIDFFMFPGEYGLELTLPGYRTLNVPLTVQNAEGNDFSFTMNRIAGDLTLSVTPSTARTFIDEIEVTGRTVIPLSPGLHTIRVQSNGYDTYQSTFTMVEGTPLTLPITLTPHTGSARFTIRPIDTRVTLYNSSNMVVRQWTGSNLIDGLPVGVYRFTAQLQGYVDQTQQVVISRDEEQDVLFTFTDAMSVANIQKTAEQLRQEELARQQAEARRLEQQRRAQQAAQQQRESMYRDGVQFSLYTGSIDNANYEQNIDYTLGLGLGQFWDIPMFRFVADVGMLALMPTEDSPLYDETDGEGVVGLYASGLAGPKLNLGSSGFSVFAGVGYRTSAYYLLDYEDYPSQSLNSVFAEAQVGWKSFQFFYRQGLKSTPENQTLLEFGILFR